MMEDHVSKVRVINKNKMTIDGRFNGKDYKFKPNVPLDVPEIVANHVFGFGDDDKMKALNRLGWARSSDEIAQGMELLGKVEFLDPPEMIEAPAKPKRVKAPKEISPAGPPVEAGGTEGGGFNSPPNGPKIGEAPSPTEDDDADTEDGDDEGGEEDDEDEF